MEHNHQLVPLGIVNEQVPPGTHICQLYSDHEEQDKALLDYLVSGINGDERIACFSDRLNDDLIEKRFLAENISYADCRAKGILNLAGIRETYLKENVFDIERSIGELKAFYQETQELGFPFARIIGEMTADIMQAVGGDRLLEYESKVTMLLEKHPMLTVCQYNINSLDGATLMNILSVHPKTIVNGSILNNPFHIPPETYLAHASKN
ncbi:MAG: MEDS domain-containing protein [Candidatus Marinimicrobia bacterium]|nr:MEDS domain-containing protein [Candidatus Neomarinimicrobiota bacterium]MCF7850027.1 MEDS domain-containing protein [Candidatus Neomarinimicrobiota bacterium]